MNAAKWLAKNTESLKGKKVAVSGSTGGLGKELCSLLAGLGADLVLLDRNEKRQADHKASLLARFPEISVECLTLDQEDIHSAKRAVEDLIAADIDLFIPNAGAYSIPRKKCSTGFDNVFQINFATPYYMTRRLLPHLSAKGGRVVLVGSIAHNYSKIDPADIDFSTRTASSKVYGNSKRFLMFSAYHLFEGEKSATLAVTHPGVTFTGITNHYPKLIFALIKHPMKIIFMKPKTAALSLLKGVFEETAPCRWIGPRFFNVWGLPKNQPLKTCKKAEQQEICRIAEEVYRTCLKTAEE